MIPRFSYAEFNHLKDFRAHVTEDTFAIMLEPIQGEGGVNPAIPEFLKSIASFAKKKGLLLLIDEIRCSWCPQRPDYGLYGVWDSAGYRLEG